MLRNASKRAALPWILVICLFVSPPPSSAYSVFTHQQIVDLSWKSLIEPLLLSRYPRTTEEDLNEAHSYAYGGCAIQDMGYYPFGKQFFSDLTHYVRTGDFIMALLRDARDVDEYAFALGALSHYVGDNIGHHDAVNQATALSFPKLAAKYGPIVTYDENRHAHVRTEFAFDIGQLSKHRLAPTAYLEFIGLRVSQRLLQEAFFQTYGLSLRSVLGPEAPAIRSYGTAVRHFLPSFAHAETVIHREDFLPDVPNAEFDIYMKHLTETDFEKLWNPYRRKPTVWTHLLALLIRISPKIGPVSNLAIKIPTEQSEDLYITSVNRSVELFRELLKTFKEHPKSIPPIPNRDLDTGETSKPGAYRLTDETYADLLHKIAADPGRRLPEDLRDDLLHYYAEASAPIKTKQNPKAWQRVLSDLATLKAMEAR